MFTVRASRALLIGIALAVCPACKKDEITAYRVPKEAPPALPGPATGGEMGGLGGAPVGHAGLSWTIPNGWKEQAASGMRAGSFRAPGAGGKDVDISVVPLAGDAGGELANVNRWRGQLGLPPVDASNVSSVVKSVRLGSHEARLVEFSNGQGQRLLAAVLRNNATTYFFKASGDDAAVRSVKSAFLSFVGSVRFESHE